MSTSVLWVTLENMRWWLMFIQISIPSKMLIACSHESYNCHSNHRKCYHSCAHSSMLTIVSTLKWLRLSTIQITLAQHLPGWTCATLIWNIPFACTSNCFHRACCSCGRYECIIKSWKPYILSKQVNVELESVEFVVLAVIYFIVTIVYRIFPNNCLCC